MKIKPLLGHLLCLKTQNRTLNIMKVTIFLTFFCTFPLFASTGKAQNAVIELPSNAVTVETLFSEIQQPRTECKEHCYFVKEKSQSKRHTERTAEKFQSKIRTYQQLHRIFKEKR